MADTPIVIADAGDDTPAVGQLFKDINFFLSVRLPLRSRFVADVEANGGRVVKLEKHADFVIVDHARKPTPAGSFSYTLIEQAVRDGCFPNPADHALGPAADSPRAVGLSTPTKRTRTAFTAADDVALWQWVELAKAQGGLIKGNDVYKRLEATNPRHTWQAWRDHYVKKLMHRPPPEANISSNASPSQNIDQDSEGANADDFDLLWAQAKDIENMKADSYEDAWEMWAQIYDKFDAVEWRHFWENEVRPVYRAKLARAMDKPKRRRTLTSDGENEDTPGSKSRKRDKRRAGSLAEGDVESDLTIEASSAAEIDGGCVDSESAQVAVDDDLEAPDEDLAALESWRESTKRKAGSSCHLDRSDVPTSEVGRAVDQQPRAENGAASRSASPLSKQNSTLDLNHAADLQLQNETNGLVTRQKSLAENTHEQSTTSEAKQTAATQLPSRSFLVAAVGQTGYGQNGSINGGSSSQEILRKWYAEQVAELEGGMDPTKAGSDSEAAGKFLQVLTEANLASQQAQHEKPLTRGVDLPKDDQNKDQSEYVKFLQNVTGQPQVEHEDLEAALDIPSKNSMLSQHEVDNVMENALDWPSSPRKKREEQESRETRSETRLPRARLTGDNCQNQGQYSAKTGRLPATRQHPNGTQEAARHMEHHMAQPDIFEGLDDINDTQIDLSMPEPEGDFTFTSSPAREGLVMSQKRGDVIEPKSADKNAQKEPSNVVVDILSDVSSSALSTSHAAEALPMPARFVQGRKTHALETQDIINAETQAPDFFMPLPDDEQDNADGHARHTQESPAVETQVAEFFVPLPADWDSDSGGAKRASGNNPARQPKPKQKVVESQTMDVERELESWLDTQQVRGFNEASTIAAMQRSSMRPELAELILHAEKGGLGLPDDVPGIWTEREDHILESGDSGALRRLEAKHGWDECDARMRFLAEWREA